MSRLLSQEVIIQEGDSILSIVLFTLHHDDLFNGFPLHPLEDLILSLLIRGMSVHIVQCVVMSLREEMLQLLDVEMVPYHFPNGLIVEESHLPFVQVEALREIFIVGMLEPNQILEGYQVLDTLRVTLHKHIVEDVSTSCDMSLELCWSVLDLRVLYYIDKEDHDVLKCLCVELAEHHLIFGTCGC